MMKFNGNRTMWQRVWNQLETSVHLRPSMSPWQKFNYLMVSIVGIRGCSDWRTTIFWQTLREGSKHRQDEFWKGWSFIGGAHESADQFGAGQIVQGQARVKTFPPERSCAHKRSRVAGNRRRIVCVSAIADAKKRLSDNRQTDKKAITTTDILKRF